MSHTAVHTLYIYAGCFATLNFYSYSCNSLSNINSIGSRRARRCSTLLCAHLYTTCKWVYDNILLIVYGVGLNVQYITACCHAERESFRKNSQNRFFIIKIRDIYTKTCTFQISVFVRSVCVQFGPLLHFELMKTTVFWIQSPQNMPFCLLSVVSQPHQLSAHVCI